jgi:hypothetical protein
MPVNESRAKIATMEPLTRQFFEGPATVRGAPEPGNAASSSINNAG